MSVPTHFELLRKQADEATKTDTVILPDGYIHTTRELDLWKAAVAVLSNWRYDTNSAERSVEALRAAVDAYPTREYRR